MTGRDAGLNLRQVVQDVTRSAESLEYTDLADAVLARLDSAEYADALRQVLPSYCRDVVSAMRAPGPVRPPAPHPTLDARAPHSWKVTAIREGWQRRLSEVYATSDGNKRLGDFTYDDLAFQAEVNQRQAKQKLAKAKGWRSLADTLRDAGVDRVRDLPAETLMHTLGAVA